MFVLIAGGGRTGARLANLLLNENYKVRLVENLDKVWLIIKYFFLKGHPL